MDRINESFITQVSKRQKEQSKQNACARPGNGVREANRHYLSSGACKKAGSTLGTQTKKYLACLRIADTSLLEVLMRIRPCCMHSSFSRILTKHRQCNGHYDGPTEFLRYYKPSENITPCKLGASLEARKESDCS